MRLTLTKEIVRNATAYKFARSITDGFLLTFICLAIINVGVGIFYLQRVPPDTQPEKSLMVLMQAGCVFAGFLVIVISYLVREIIQALFDVADGALLNRKTPGAAENPFSA